MCGIAGIIGPAPPGLLNQQIIRMTDSIAHRGPDDKGHYVGPHAAIGMCRLSIIDLAGGLQPMWLGEEGVTPAIIFNGEIYNYQTLRSELVGCGNRLRTHSDTETVLQLYARYGIRGCLNRLDGMFALCLYDPQSRCIHLARDPLGKKPLYYGVFDDRLYFASELKAILAVLPNRPEINETALDHYLTLRYVPGPDSIWQGIRKLPPGHFLTVSLDDLALHEECWWRNEFCSEPIDEGRDYEAEFSQLFLASVEKRLVAADVPVGVLLSGGLDSSAVLAAAKELGHESLHTFSIAFSDGGEFNELPYARLAAEHTGANYHEVTINQQQFVNFLPRLVEITDEPLADLASIPLYYVSQLARETVKVVLSGEGSDEVLAGYDMDRVAARLDWFKRIDTSLGRTAAKLVAPVAGNRARLLRAFSQNGHDGMFAALGTHITKVWSDQEKRALLGRNVASSDDLVRAWYRAVVSKQPLDQMQQVYCNSWLVEDLLMKADKTSMANSLELRVPFLDHALVEWAGRLPIEWKVGKRGHWRSKRILREFSAKRLPAAILERPKLGFPVPAYAWLRGPLGKWASDLVTGSNSKLRDWIDVTAAEPTVRKALSGERAAAEKLWSLVILELWLERWV